MIGRAMKTTSPFHRHDSLDIAVPAKATRVLHIVLFALILILLRVWYLSVIQHDERVKAAELPTRRTVIEAARRAGIRDRFGHPLALNKVQFNAAVVYTEIAAIPAAVYEKDSNGKRIRRYKRREHIRNLAELLGDVLQIDATELEDRIHAEATFFDHAPYVIKSDITEEQFYRLKMLEASYIGLVAQRVPKRYYPYQEVAGDIIGYMGAIDAETYQSLLHERRMLTTYLREREIGEDPPLPMGLVSPQTVRQRLTELEDKAYAINDFVGKSGLEGYFEQDLRGYYGKKRYHVDSKGNYLRQLPWPRQPTPGNGLTLALSVELQEFAEQLLAINEQIRTTRVSKPHRKDLEDLPVKEPWIKGGAIVVLDPNSGDLLAMASYPRYNPNDFIPSGDASLDAAKKANIHRWFETDSYIGQIWDGRRPLKRERWDAAKGFYNEEKPLSWQLYQDLLFDAQGDVQVSLRRLGTIAGAISLQRASERLIELSGQGDLRYLFNLLYQDEGHQLCHCPLPASERERIEGTLNMHADEVEQVKKQLDKYLARVKHAYDKVLLVDLCRVVVETSRFSPALEQTTGLQSLQTYRENTQAFLEVHTAVQQMAKELFRQTSFKAWRQTHEKEFLRLKRKEEQLAGRHAKPYTAYLNTIEEQLFHSFWERHGLELTLLFLRGNLQSQQQGTDHPHYHHFLTWHKELASGAHTSVDWYASYRILQNAIGSLDDALAYAYLRSMRSYKELTRPLHGSYRQLRNEQGKQYEKHLAAGFYPTYGFGHARSLAFRQATPQGSIFKLVTAYEALCQRYTYLKTHQLSLSDLNPLRIVDSPKRIGGQWIVGYTMNGQPIPQHYKGGLLPKTQVLNLGEMDLVRAIEVSSNSYFALLTSDVLAHPRDLTDAALSLSLGRKTGICLPGEIAGRMPSDVEYDRNALYSLAIGQHSLVVTPLQTAVMLAALANGGTVFQPNLVHTIGSRDSHAQRYRDPDYNDSLLLAGIDFPLFVGGRVRHAQADQVIPDVHADRVFMPKPVHHMLLEGMTRVANKYLVRSLSLLKETYATHPEAIQAIAELRHQIAGKTSTAECMENFGPDRQIGTRTYNHVWFGSIVFAPNGEPGRQVVLYDGEGKPELVVVVYLRYGAFGRDAIPIAAQIATKWREIKAKARI